ncbi:hypothetical protein SAMN06295912_10298 [Sphingomonas laterariae]|uniref:Uncharacterized protein n=1 Tax=Edaphosphingomonas laterariae TaxID=861865 RepID=A0A239CAI0_9SPHN|nr:hypothetical protein [Sphingomonas laterariae]SNS17217.1 hypothetical protein SAMN06295912_10298 [Sphingomonas laterariae]
MIGAGLLTTLLLAGSGAAGAIADSRMQIAQLSIRQSVVIRVPARSRAAVPLEWKESKGPKCISMPAVAGAAAIKPDSVDIVLRGGGRVRAQFEDECPALDFYGGFYIRPTEDNRVCAGRDAVHARSGGECQIRRFRTLTPEKSKKK